MTPATASALLLLAAGLLHSFSFMCRKLPVGRRPALYPKSPLSQSLLNLVWMILMGMGLLQAFRLSAILGMTAVLLYFVALPFVFQPPMARMLGFRDLRHYLDEVAGDRP